MNIKNIQKLRFLHIDDFGNYRTMLKSILSSLGIKNIDDAKDAEQALSRIKENHYDVILCDYNLGEGKNGQQLLEEVMHNRLIAYGTIFIMVTADNTSDMVMAAIEYRPDAYLNKPFPKELLLSRLDKLLTKKEAFESIYKAYNDLDYPKAISRCNKKMIEYPKLALDIGKLKGEIALKANMLDVAQTIYDKALDMRSFDWAMYGKARVLYHQQRYDEAQHMLEDLLTENGNYIEAFDLLVLIHEAKHELDKSQEILQQATKLSPITVFRQQKLAETALKNNDTTTAEKSLKAAILHGKNSILGKSSDHTELAKIYIDKGKIPQASKVINNAKQLFRKDKDSILHTNILESMLYLKQGNEDKSREILTTTIQNMDTAIHHLPKNLQNDLIHQCEKLNEEEMVAALKEDIANQDEGIQKYSYLLMNGQGMRLYNNNKLYEASKNFIQAADKLTQNISVNLNAAQAIIMMLRKHHVTDKSEQKQYKDQARHYLDIGKKIDASNGRYNKLEMLYKEV